MKCPLCKKKTKFGLMRDEIGNRMCKECFIEIQVRIANNNVVFTYDVPTTSTSEKLVNKVEKELSG